MNNNQTIILMTPLLLQSVMTPIGNIEFIIFSGDSSIFLKSSVICVTPFNDINQSFIEQLPENIKLIVSIGVGTEHIDVHAANAKGIMVTNTPVVTEDTADLTFSLLLATSRRLNENEAFLRAGHWTVDNPIGVIGQSVHSKTLGIIGFGAIGQAVARRAKGFNMEVVYYNPTRKLAVEEVLDATYCDTVEGLLKISDIITLHCPLTDKTRHLIDKKTLSLMKPSSILLNVGRGALVNEEDLVEALKNNQINAAGLDVFEHEPTVSPELLTLKNVTLLPHIGSATSECRENMVKTMLKNVVCFLTQDQKEMNIVKVTLTDGKAI